MKPKSKLKRLTEASLMALKNLERICERPYGDGGNGEDLAA
jgi:hypothetical protein